MANSILSRLNGTETECTPKMATNLFNKCLVLDVTSDHWKMGRRERLDEYVHERKDASISNRLRKTSSKKKTDVLRT